MSTDGRSLGVRVVVEELVLVSTAGSRLIVTSCLGVITCLGVTACLVVVVSWLTSRGRRGTFSSFAGEGEEVITTGVDWTCSSLRLRVVTSSSSFFFAFCSSERRLLSKEN